MAFRKLSANFILSTGSGFLKNGILIIDHNHRVIDLIDTGGNLKEESNLEFYNGLLTPGFIKLHSHLELFHLQEQISVREVDPDNNKYLIPLRNREMNKIGRSAVKAGYEMRLEGIVAVAGNLDSYDKVSILAEMIVIQKHNPEILLEALLNYATLIGAQILEIDGQFGSFEKGKIPGVNLIEHVDLQRMILTERSGIKIIA